MKANLITNENLTRKQFLLSTSQISKLSSLSASEGKSEAEVVRLAIDAFDPKAIVDINTTELMELVLQRLDAAITSTQQANKAVANALDILSTSK